MAFNPRDNRPSPAKAPDMGGSGKPGVVLTQLQRLEAEAKSEASFKPKTKLKVLDEKLKPLPNKLEYYIEWWKIGTDHAAIEAGHFHTANIKNFARTFLATGKYTLVYLKRMKDGKVLQDRRSTLNR